MSSSVLFRERTPAVDALIEERAKLGIDRYDEVWEGVYVVNPAPRRSHNLLALDIVALLVPHARERHLSVVTAANVGHADDFRIPDVVVYPTAADGGEADDVYIETASIVVEVLSPGERVDKRSFYLARGVAEVVLVDPAAGTVMWLGTARDGTQYQPVRASAVLPLGPADIAALLAR